ncbi:MAG: bifunctional N(6)-L-threonylcarbamoyladenine synthase/serine/threonine protein kinase [Candidatus Altiarchaeota archaeon]|nr:bifunctional N(6)-L-threonylcarbamoyladenine synthase/serine/threonine protein kinase [Candidatus Altiarchaeota archaeon]
MIALGIEGTAHTLGVGLTDSENKVLADVRKTYSPKAGIHPREAAQFIGENFRDAVDLALEKSGTGFEEIGLIAFSQGPGLGPCLRTVATGARALSLHHGIPLLGVNHCVAHIEIGKVFCGLEDPLILYVSGGNTQVIKCRDGRYRIFGETLDIGVGNMLDKFGRETGLSHPAGPKIEKLASKGNGYIELPYAVKGTDLSFSGILTAAVNNFRSSRHSLEDICYSLQETSFSMLTEVTERALAHLGAREVLLTGGVGNNKRLTAMLEVMCRERDGKEEVRFGVPEGYCSDNGVMIALLGRLMYDSGIRQDIDETQVKQRFRTDLVEISW